MKEIWTQEVEEALAKYVRCEDKVEKNKIFDDHLFIPFRKLIAALLERYSIPNVDDDMKFDILTYLVECVERFNPDAVRPDGKKTSGKAYCITLIRCWIADWKLKYSRQKKTVSFESCHEIHMRKIQ
jgi:hypothetical protein